MKILYAIQATGNGHISRAQHLLPKFNRRVEVAAILSGPSTEIELGSRIVKHYKGITFFYTKNGAINWLKTLFKNNVLRFIFDVLNAPVKQYDLVVNDFEPITAWACYLRGVRCVSISNQHALLSKKIPKPKKKYRLGLKMMRYFAPIKSGYGLHYKKYNKRIFYPVIREKIRALKTSETATFLVYLPSYHPNAIAAVLNKIPNHKWAIFNNSIKTYSKKDNVEFYPIDEKKFMTTLAGAKGVICTAGFTLPAEVLYLKKPLIAIPLATQIEQQFNCAALKEMGVVCLKKFDLKQVEKITKWADHPKVVPYHWEDESEALVERVFLDYIKYNLDFSKFVY